MDASEFKEVRRGRYPYIGILGATGAGKSTLTNILSISHFEEEYGENPFLEAFYSDPSRYSYLSERWFLLSKVKQMKGLLPRLREAPQVHDPCLEMDLIYAQTHFQMGWLTKGQFESYKKTLETLQTKLGLPRPDLHVVVNTSGDVCKERIRIRGRKMELKLLESDYFDLLVQGVADWAVWAKDSSLGVVEIDGASLDFTNNGRDRSSVAQLVNDRILLCRPQ